LWILIRDSDRANVIGRRGVQTADVTWDVEPLRRENGERAVMVGKQLANGIGESSSLRKTEVGAVVWRKVVAQEGGELRTA